jgi:hypothetical protein
MDHPQPPHDAREHPKPKLTWFQQLRVHALEEAAEGSLFFAYIRILAARYGAPAWLFLGVMALFWFLFWLFAVRPY